MRSAGTYRSKSCQFNETKNSRWCDNCLIIIKNIGRHKSKYASIPDSNETRCSGFALKDDVNDSAITSFNFFHDRWHSRKCSIVLDIDSTSTKTRCSYFDKVYRNTSSDCKDYIHKRQILSITPDEETVKVTIKKAVEENDSTRLRMLSKYIENEFIKSKYFDLDDGRRWIVSCNGVGVNSFSDINITFE